MGLLSFLAEVEHFVEAGLCGHGPTGGCWPTPEECCSIDPERNELQGLRDILFVMHMDSDTITCLHHSMAQSSISVPKAAPASPWRMVHVGASVARRSVAATSSTAKAEAEDRLNRSNCLKWTVGMNFRTTAGVVQVTVRHGTSRLGNGLVGVRRCVVPCSCALKVKGTKVTPVHSYASTF